MDMDIIRMPIPPNRPNVTTTSAFKFSHYIFINTPCHFINRMATCAFDAGYPVIPIPNPCSQGRKHPSNQGFATSGVPTRASQQWKLKPA